MKKYFFVLMLFFVSCKQEKVTYLPNYIETKSNLVLLKHNNALDNTWIRQPKNIISVHETFKKIGYKNLISSDLLNDSAPFVNNYVYIKGHSLYNLIDSLEINYTVYETAPKYYKEFWQRRILEKNDSIVYEVLREVKAILILEEELSYDEEMINDTLFTLLSYEYPKRELTQKELNLYIEDLMAYDLHHSAYNLISGEHNSKIDIKQLEKYIYLKRSDTPLYFHPWLMDNTK